MRSGTTGGPPVPQELAYEAVANRLDWHKKTSASVRDVIAENDRFAIRFVYTACFFLTQGKFDVDNTYFVYPPREGKLSERWLLADAGFDHKATGAEGTLSR